MPLSIRSLQEPDQKSLQTLLNKGGLFSEDEVSCALELIHESVTNPTSGYDVLVAENEGQVVGYVCYGPTPMTASTWDLYWIVTDASVRRQGIGSHLLIAMENDIIVKKGALIRVETSTLDGYGAAREFYQKHAYDEVLRITDFYKPHDDLIVLTKRF